MENILKYAHIYNVEDVLRAVKVDENRGLSENEIRKRIMQYGFNELEVEKKKGILELILNQFDDLLVKILLLAAFVSFALTLLDMKDNEVALCDFIEPVVILMILILNAAVGVWQECNAEKSLEALKQLQPTKAKVLRDGKWEIIDSKYLTVGDIIELSVGNKTPADARIIKIFSTSIKAEQSMLTGESCSVDKYVEKLDESLKNCEIQLKKNILFSSTAIVAGRCTAVVIKIGMNTEIGNIQHAVIESNNEETDTPLQIKIDSFGKQLSKIIFIICVTVWIINFKHFSDPIHESFLYGCLYYFKISVALAVAAIPEGLPAVITTCLALGTRRMVKKNAIVRKLQSVETLGCTTVICSDKTGTLTTNQMTATVFHIFRESNTLKEYQLCQRGDTFFFYETNQDDENDSFFNKLKESSNNESSYKKKISKNIIDDDDDDDDTDYEREPLINMKSNVNTIISRGSKIIDDKINKYIYSDFDYHFYMCLCNCNEASILCNVNNKILKTFGDSTELALLHFVHNFNILPNNTKNNKISMEYEKKNNMTKHNSDINGGYDSSTYKKNKISDKKSEPTFPSKCVSAWRNECTIMRIIEFTRERKLMSVVVENNKNEYILYCKGAPENIINRCKYYMSKNDIRPLTDSLKNEILNKIKNMGKRALRTLSFAYKKVKSNDINIKNSEDYYKLEHDLIYIGGLGIIDPPRKYVGKAISLCHLAGIRVFMITGDNIDTAKAIAKEINILNHDDTDKYSCCFNGREFEDLPLEKQKYILKNYQQIVFCRTEPKHKKNIVKVLKDLGETVAMTGDGVNDAPALKSADIGIAMGINGTQVAKEASDIILADDNFNTIVEAIKEGRCIYNNMKAFIRYLISSNIGEVASIFITAILGIPDSLAPVQLLWVNLVTDGLPATALGKRRPTRHFSPRHTCYAVFTPFSPRFRPVFSPFFPRFRSVFTSHHFSLLPTTSHHFSGFNPPEHDVMKCKPRHRNDNLINGLTLLRYIVIGTYVGIATVSIFIYWYMFYPDMDNHTLINFYQLSHYNQCKTWSNFNVNKVYGMSEDLCSYFSAGKVKASTLSLSVLVLIEMFNALNALSEYNSLFVLPPWRNMYLVFATIGSLFLHCLIIYFPPLAGIFGVVPLTLHDWFLVFLWSFPVIIIDEIIKFYAKKQLNKELGYGQKLKTQ